VGFVGVTARLVSWAAVTVTAAVAVAPSKVAVTVALPAESAVATWRVSAVVPKATAAGFEEVQVASAVTLWLVRSSKKAVALKAWLAPTASRALAGSTWSPVTWAALTRTVVAPVVPPRRAEIEALPAETPRTSPGASGETAAIAEFEELQEARVVRSWMAPLA
jgi:hypothetical protein